MTTTNRPEPQLTTQFTTPNDTELVATRTFDAPRELVWAAHTDPKHVRQWLLGPDGWSMPVCEIDLRVGGAWRYVWRSDADGREFGMHGVYLEIDAPRRLVQTERMAPEMPETQNTMELTEENGRTRLTVTVQYPSKEVRDMALGTGMKGGWSQSNDRLERYLETLR